MVTWDLLISTIPHRHEKLCGLLAELGRQWQPGLGVLLLRDNWERHFVDSHDKRQQLVEASAADYISSVDDDDWITEDYVQVIMAALAEGPDYVGFRVNCTMNGRPWRHADHSLEHRGYTAEGSFFVRDITHLNPLRREHARQVSWHGKIDEEWAADLRALGLVRSEVYIDRELYYYRADTGDCFYTDRAPVPEPLPAIPEYPWLTVLASSS